MASFRLFQLLAVKCRPLSPSLFLSLNFALFLCPSRTFFLYSIIFHGDFGAHRLLRWLSFSCLRLQTFMTERVSDVQRRGSAEVEKVLMEYLTKNGAFM